MQAKAEQHGDGGDPATQSVRETGSPASDVAGATARVVGGAVQKVGHELGHRRGLRVGLIGIALLILSASLGADSAMTVPVAVAGLLFLAAGLLGRRLAGRFAIEWGPAGSVLEMRAALAPVGMTATDQGRTLPAPAVAEGEVADAEVIEATGETIELDVAELQAMLAEHEAKAKAEALSDRPAA